MNQQRELNEKNREIMELYKKTATVNNNTNNISINIFLNEHCKDAMNLTDFVKSLELSLDDLDYTGKHGYSKGIANILIKNLGDIDPTSRPIHCTDKKRLQFYVKDDDQWEQDGSHNKVDKTIETITQKQIQNVKEGKLPSDFGRDWENLAVGTQHDKRPASGSKSSIQD